MNSRSKPIQSPSGATEMTCGVCGRRFLLDETQHPPFCSQRCKMIDLGRWLEEEISVPHEGGPSKGETVDED